MFSSKPSDAEIEKSDRSVDNKEEDDVDAADEPDFEEIDVSEDDDDDDDGIEVGASHAAQAFISERVSRG